MRRGGMGSLHCPHESIDGWNDLPHGADAGKRNSPFQISVIDLNEYIEKRKQFEAGEWLDFLINSVGLNPSGREVDAGSGRQGRTGGMECSAGETIRAADHADATAIALVHLWSQPR